jgi:hypothetical protein
MDGEIAVDTKQEAGTCFAAWLPRNGERKKGR